MSLKEPGTHSNLGNCFYCHTSEVIVYNKKCRKCYEDWFKHAERDEKQLEKVL